MSAEPDKFSDIDLKQSLPFKTDASLFAGASIGHFKCDGCPAEQQTPMKQCGDCRKVQYCSQKCQIDHWDKHSAGCVNP